MEQSLQTLKCKLDDGSRDLGYLHILLHENKEQERRDIACWKQDPVPLSYFSITLEKALRHGTGKALAVPKRRFETRPMLEEDLDASLYIVNKINKHYRELCEHDTWKIMKVVHPSLNIPR